MRARRVSGALAATAALIAAAPAQAATGPHVVGGTVALGARPYMVAVSATYPAGVTALCGGTLVAARYVVTAGHCVASDATLGGLPTRVSAVVGATDLLTDAAAERYADVAVVRDPAFTDGDGAPSNDVAVLRLPTPSSKLPARLPRAGDAHLWAEGLTATALGYGLTDPADDTSGSTQLREVRLPIAAGASCARVYGAAFGATDLCAGGVPGHDTCQGDSGGPLVVADPSGTVPVLAGVTSYGEGCGRTYGVYAATGGTLDAFLRSVVAQVEIDPPAGGVIAGRAATFAAAARAPGATGPYGGYDALAWDTDGDGAFDDGTGTTATARLAAGAHTISVLATDAAGDREVRTVIVTARRLAAALRLTGPRTQRLRGRRVRLTVRPDQAGQVRVAVRRGGVALGRARTFAVTGDEARRLTVRLSPAGLRRVRRAGRLRVVLAVTLTPAAGGAARTARRVLTLYR